MFIQGPHRDQFDLMWARSLKRWKERMKKGNKKGRKERQAKGRREER